MKPVSQWQTVGDKNGINIIENFMGTKIIYLFFQMMAYISRLATLKNAVRKIKIRMYFWYVKDLCGLTDMYLLKCYMMRVKLKT